MILEHSTIAGGVTSVIPVSFLVCPFDVVVVRFRLTRNRLHTKIPTPTTIMPITTRPRVTTTPPPCTRPEGGVINDDNSLLFCLSNCAMLFHVSRAASLADTIRCRTESKSATARSQRARTSSNQSPPIEEGGREGRDGCNEDGCARYVCVRFFFFFCLVCVMSSGVESRRIPIGSTSICPASRQKLKETSKEDTNKQQR